VVINVEVIRGGSPVLICCDNAAGVQNIFVFLGHFQRVLSGTCHLDQWWINWWVEVCSDKAANSREKNVLNAKMQLKM